MEISGAGKPPNTSLSFRYNANNEELEELYDACDDDPPTPQFDASPSIRSENASPKRGDKTPSILDKYFKSIRTEKVIEKLEDVKPIEPKVAEEGRSPPKDVTSSPMKEYLNRLGKRSTPEVPEVKEGTNETWKLFHDFKFKIAQAVEDMKTRSLDDSTKEKSIPRDSSISDSEENSAIKDSDQSVGDTDNQVSSLDSSIQNLSEMTQPVTAKPAERESSLPLDNKNHSDSSDDTHKNLVHSDLADLTRDVHNTNLLDVESGVEALEDGIDGFGDITPMDTTNSPSNKPTENVPIKTPLIPINFNLPPSKSNLRTLESTNSKQFFNFTMYFLTFLLLLNYILFPKSNIWNGFFLGIWFFCFVTNLKQYLLDNFFSEWEPSKTSFFQLKKSSSMPPIYTIPSVKEHRPIKKYEGWINHYRFSEYDPLTYHINKTTTAFMKLEGCNLRISYTKTKIGKRALWDEKLEKVVFYQHRLYNLTGARIMLLPNGLVKRRQWSKKYPICIILNEKEKIQILEKESSSGERRASEFTAEKKKEQQSQQEMESTETNTSPEKKKKFVWRRRDKSIPHSEAEVGKEGLRHRLVRKMHRDKKTDSVSTSTETVHCQNQDKNQQMEESSFHDAEMDLATKSMTSTRDDAEEELDETEFSRIKEFLEEAELDGDLDGPVEGEWSLHIKNSRDNHSQLFLFARTGRDKLEWYRRLMSAIHSAKAAISAAESTAADEKSSSEPSPEGKEGIEMAVYKLTEKENIAFAKGTPRLDSTATEGVTVSAPGSAVLNNLEHYEKTFWPYLIKIIESHEMTYKTTSEVGVTCQIEPSPRGRIKNKKKIKEKDQKTPSPSCQCRVLPAEVTWVNTLLARVIYDITQDPQIRTRLKSRVQRKLHTLKLPSFMSPLLVTELSLAGACPLIERVSGPSWDERGVWLDADLRYEGGAFITILTQINLMKLKEKNITLEEHMLNIAENEQDEVKETTAKNNSSEQSIKGKQAAFDSDVEDSAESSSDDETPLVQPVDSGVKLPQAQVDTSFSNEVPGSSKNKFLRMVDKIATNKYFQQVTDYKYVKRAMEGLSNTDIKLQVEVHGLEGRLAINLPPPPHDRIWLGFRTNPQLVLKARPAVGARSLRFAHISNWIEQKLGKEFEKVLVLPNMEDFLIGVMTPTPVDYE